MATQEDTEGTWVQIEMVKGKGPSRENTLASLTSWHSNGRLQVKFVLHGQAREVASVHPLPLDRDEIEVMVTIDGMQWEDGRGDSFNLTGYATSVVGQAERLSNRVKIYYHTSRREGTISFRL